MRWQARIPEVEVEVEAEPDESIPAKPNGAGQRIGRYRLCFELASGGMATVYLARVEGAAGFEKLVALKQIHPHLARDPNFVQMFLDEARIASQITHPNVCGVTDFGEANGSYYLAMDYLVGEPLSRCMRALVRRPDLKLSSRLPALAARIVADACEGLHAAHELRDVDGKLLNVVHRDVSPHNLFITYDGNVRVVDFGIASASHRVHKTTTGTVKGKYAYMAPEQFRGSDVDRRADVWSLGVVLWELVTCRRLFRRQTEMETIFAVGSEPIPPPSQIRPRIPPDLDAVVLKALQRDRDLRYSTARELGRDLLKFMALQPEPVGLADLAEWMEGLFPDGQERRRQLIEIARQSVDIMPQVPEGLRDRSETESLSLAKSLVDEGGSRLGPLRKKRAMMIASAAAAAIVLGAVIGIASGGRLAKPVQPIARPAVPSWPTTRPKASKPITPPTAPVVRHAVPVETPPEIPTKRSERENRPSRSSGSKTAHSRRNNSPVAPTGTGTVNVVTPGGWALVYKGNRKLGQTPMRVELPAGKHVLELRPFGEPPARRVTVVVVANEVQRIVERISQ